ncbi:MAG: peptidylprolyl isomerase [Akkermansia sp.]
MNYMKRMFLSASSGIALLSSALLALPAIAQQGSLFEAGPLPSTPNGAPAAQQQTQQAKPKAQAQIINRVAATVNGRPITANEVSFLLMPIGGQLATLYPRQGPEFQKQLTKAKKDIINDLIERELVLCDFETKGYQMRDSIIDQEVARTIKETFNGNRDKFLANLKNSGLNIRSFKDLTKRRLIVMAMRSSKYDQDIPPTPDEINKEYNATKSHFRDMTKDRIKFKKIFIPMRGEDPSATPEVQLSLSELITKELQSGKASFAEMAAKYSKDQMADKGGDWPITVRENLSPEFTAIMFNAPENKIIGPLIDPNGFMIVIVEKKELAPPPPLSKIKEQIDSQVRSKRSNERYQQWVNRLRNKAIIKTFI